MVTLVLGGAASGKSACAEDLLLAAPARPRVYGALGRGGPAAD